MDKYRKYLGVLVFFAALFVMVFCAYKLVYPKIEKISSLKSEVSSKETELETQKGKLENVQKNIKRIKDSILTSQKKIYSPIESDLGNETLFFTLYNDVIEMVHANSVKIRTIDYTYNPETDEFVKFGKDVYFVCDVNLELVSNYVNLGKLIQDIYQYPYYIKINDLDVKPYAKDKKILISNLSLRLYAHTSPDEEEETASSSAPETPAAAPIAGAAVPLPQ